MDQLSGAIGPCLILIVALGLVFRAAADAFLRRIQRKKPSPELEILLYVAMNEARRRRHSPTEPNHFILALLAHPGIVRALRHRGASIEDIRETVSERLRTPPGTGISPALPCLSARSKAVLTRTGRHVRARWRANVRAEDVLRALARDRDTGPLLRATVNVEVLQAALAQRTGSDEGGSHFSIEAARQEMGRAAGPYRASLMGAHAKIVFHNDGRSTMEFVCEVLCRFFSRSKGEAEYLMLMVHYFGRAVVDERPRDEADLLVREALAFATERSMPLQIRVETIDPLPQPSS